MKLFELAEGKGILNRGTQQHRVKTKYHRPSQERVDYDEEPSTPLQIAIKKAKDIRYHNVYARRRRGINKSRYCNVQKKKQKN